MLGQKLCCQLIYEMRRQEVPARTLFIQTAICTKQIANMKKKFSSLSCSRYNKETICFVQTCRVRDLSISWIFSVLTVTLNQNHWKIDFRQTLEKKDTKLINVALEVFWIHQIYGVKSINKLHKQSYFVFFLNFILLVG